MNFHTYFSSGYLVACFVVVLGVLVSLSLAQGDCSTTGCQPSDWTVVGCEEYQRTEQETQPCEDDRGVGQFDACCPALLGICGDGSGGTPCCGRAACNFWCCNCGACRGRRKRDLTSGTLEPTGFQRMDKDGDGHLDIDEAHSHLKSGGCGNYTEKVVDFEHNFKKFDRDGDGKLSFAEINAAG